LFVGITYSMRDLLSDLSNYARPANWRYASDTVNDVSNQHQLVLTSCMWILCLNDLLDSDLCKNIFYFHIFLVLERDFIRCVDFTCIAASNTASDDVTN